MKIILETLIEVIKMIWDMAKQINSINHPLLTAFEIMGGIAIAIKIIPKILRRI